MPDTNPIPGLPPRSFEKADPSPDALFYEQARLVLAVCSGLVNYLAASARSAGIPL